MARALVLGGGGPVGIGWESGLIAGLADAGIDLREADLVSGTSAGSVVGAGLRLGMDAGDTLELVEKPPAGLASTAGMEALFAALGDAAASAASQEELLVSLGRVSRQSATVDEELYVQSFAVLGGRPWPAGFQCTAVDVDSGEFRVWDGSSGASLERAVASSCAVPTIFPPVTIAGHRYMDGGMRTALNADLASGCDVAVVVSCFALELPPGFSDPVADMLTAAVQAELSTLRSSGTRVEAVAPGAEFLELSGWGLNLMDFSLARQAFAVGQRQAADEAARVAEAWGAGA